MTRLATLLVALFTAASAGAQTLAWDANPPQENVQGYRLIIDQTIYDVGNVLTFTPALAPGTHQAVVLAYDATRVSAPSSPPLSFVSGQDPCGPPLGAHAPAIFLTSVTITTGKSGSRSFLSFQLAGPDPFIEAAVQVDGIEQPMAAGTDLRPVGSMWFTHPATGSHTLGLRVLTSFGCALTRTLAAPLVVK